MRWRLFEREKPDPEDDSSEYLISDVDGDLFLGTYDGEVFSSWNAVTDSYFDEEQSLWLTEGAGIVMEPVWWLKITPPPHAPRAGDLH